MNENKNYSVEVKSIRRNKFVVTAIAGNETIRVTVKSLKDALKIAATLTGE